MPFTLGTMSESNSHRDVFLCRLHPSECPLPGWADHIGFVSMRKHTWAVSTINTHSGEKKEWVPLKSAGSTFIHSFLCKQRISEKQQHTDRLWKLCQSKKLKALKQTKHHDNEFASHLEFVDFFVWCFFVFKVKLKAKHCYTISGPATPEERFLVCLDLCKNVKKKKSQLKMYSFSKSMFCITLKILKYCSCPT